MNGAAHIAWWLGVCALCGACKHASPRAAPPVHKQIAAPTATPVSTVASDRLPENPVLAKKSELQWREHMQHEEDERQLGFDRRHLSEHRAVLKLLAAARERIDRASTQPALDKVQAQMAARVAEIRKRVTAIDHWGNNSRVLGDYAELEAELEGGYLQAKRSALKGDRPPLAAARAQFEQRVEHVRDWLERAAESDEEE